MEHPKGDTRGAFGKYFRSWDYFSNIKVDDDDVRASDVRREKKKDITLAADVTVIYAEKTTIKCGPTLRAMFKFY